MFIPPQKAVLVTPADRAAVAAACRRFASGRQVLQVRPLPCRPGRWIALFAERQGLTDDGGKVVNSTFSRFGVREFRETAIGVRPIGGELSRPLGEDDGDCACSPSLTIASIEGQPVGVLARSIPSAGSIPHELMFFRIARRGLGPPRILRSAYDVRQVPPGARHGLRVIVRPTYKVDWPDVYEWKRGRFVLANRTSGDLYRPEEWRPQASSPYYEAWMTYAAAETIAGTRREAIAAWKRAASLCAATVASHEEYPFSTWYGTPEESLAAIRRRLRWLRRSAMDHALLYRPYDFDLQVPPYRLGHAGDKP